MNARRTFPLRFAAVVFAATLSSHAGSAGKVTAYASANHITGNAYLLR